MIRITRKIEFDSGHRVLGHEGKCAHLHGHRYVAEITVESAGLDSLGRVVDFSVIKEKVGKWVDENWDHNTLLNMGDPMAAALDPFATKTLFLMPPGENPTAENMAKFLYSVAEHLLEDSLLSVVAVRMYETPNCWADYAR